MTLTSYSPEQLDQLALRLLDLAGAVRGMAHLGRENDLTGFSLHGNKLNEWLANLEDWAHDGASKMEAAVYKLRGLRRLQGGGRSAAPVRGKQPKPPRGRKAGRR